MEGGTQSLRLDFSVFLLLVMCCVIGGIIPPSQESGEWKNPCGEAPRTGPVMGLCSVKGAFYLCVIDQEVRSVHFSLRGWAAEPGCSGTRNDPWHLHGGHIHSRMRTRFSCAILLWMQRMCFSSVQQTATQLG